MGARVGAVVLGTVVTGCSLLTTLDGFSSAESSSGAPDAREANDDGGGETPDATDGATEPDPDRSAAYRDAVLADGPTGYWRFEETAGTIAKDETALASGTYVGPPTLGVPGVAGSRGVLFPAESNAHVRIDSTAYRFPGNAAYTVELWVAPGRFEDYQWLGGTQVTSLRSGWGLVARADGTLSFEVKNAGGTPRDFAMTGLKLAAFHHVVVTYDGSVGSGFVDGQRIVSRAQSDPAPDAGTLVWGCRLKDAGEPVDCLDGWIVDEVAIYPAVLS